MGKTLDKKVIFRGVTAEIKLGVLLFLLLLEKSQQWASDISVLWIIKKSVR